MRCGVTAAETGVLGRQDSNLGLCTSDWRLKENLNMLTSLRSHE